MMVAEARQDKGRETVTMAAASPMPRTLGRRHIKSFASGIAHMFACSAQHYAWLAYRHKAATVTVDLFTLRIEPSVFDIERNRILAEMCQRTLLRNIDRMTAPGTVASAVLSACFGIGDYLDDGRSASIGRSVFTAVLTDDRGKEWRVEHAETRVLVQG